MFREKEICNAIRTAYLYLFPDKKERKRALSRLNMELVVQSVRYRGESVLAYANVKNTGLFCVKDYCNHGHTGSYTLVTPKGKIYFAQLREMILLIS